MQKNTGITLVALVVTIIILLILAGVAISMIGRENGLFEKANSAAVEYKKQDLIEVIKTAEFHLKIDNQIDKTKEIDIVSLINKVKEISDVNDKDYLIYIDEEEQSATIIDKKTGIVIDVWIDENKNVNIEGSIVKDIDDAVKPTIEYTLDPKAETYGETVKITITVREEKNGIAKIQFPDNTEKIYSKEKIVVEEYEVTQNGRYKFTAKNANGRKTTIYVDVKNTMNAANIIMEVKNADNTTPLIATNDKVNVVISYDENIRIGGQALTNENRFQYSIGENHWQTATANPMTVPVTENGIVHARYFDGTNGYKVTNAVIDNIDKEAPTTTELSSANIEALSFTLVARGVDAEKTNTSSSSGIEKYEFYINGVLEKTEITSDETVSYDVKGKVSATTYSCKVRVYDAAGNYLDSEEITVTTETRVYLYKEGKEYTELTGEILTRVVSTNNYLTDSNKSFFEGNGAYSSGSATKNSSNISLRADHYNRNSGYGCTRSIIIIEKLIELKGYTKLCFTTSQYTNANAAAWVEILDETRNRAHAVDGAMKISTIFELPKLEGRYYIEFGMHSSYTAATMGTVTIYEIWLER